MPTQITWSIDWMRCKPVEGNLTDVVITAGWRCVGVNERFTSTVYSSCSFSTPGDPFTPYADLTEPQVLQWCWDNGVDKPLIEADIEQQIQEKINPPVVQLPLPWAQV